MKALLSWLFKRALLYLLLVAAIGFAALAWPSLGDAWRGLGTETMTRAELVGEIASLRDAAHEQLGGAAQAARTLPADSLRARIAQRQEDHAALLRLIGEEDRALLGPYLPSRILAAKRAEIERAAIEREIAMLEAALAPREAAARAATYIKANPTVPTMASIAASRRACIAAGEAVDDYADLSGIERAIRNLLRDEGDTLEASEQARCSDLERLTQRRRAGIEAARALIAARAALAAITPDPLPPANPGEAGAPTLREILLQALAALAAITLLPFALRVLAYWVLAPLAERRGPIRFNALGTAGEPAAPLGASGVSLSLALDDAAVALVRQDYLQSSPVAATKRTRWLLDPRHPLASLASGMRFLTAIEGAGAVTVSPVKDPFAEVAGLHLPAASAAIVRPRALAGLAHPAASEVRLTSHWRLFSLTAWLTGQLRYFAFHGPATLALKGGRGVRIEPAHDGRILGPDQVIGFSSDVAYSVVRSETFWPYFFGRAPLLKDRVEGDGGVVLIEEAPLAGRTGWRRGFAGAFDVVLKIFGI